ncbi:hypothetical protein CVT24_002786 [Panaeolus cyanescens]|uniref:Ecp2 effector protein-like domain-containing protein n=1 Tax=Panaeolus cyanescens TaxID=181874 RepID=A0A409YRF0_9AGAR|nr:hypothetical protein CVT24_002786 [Panaeolus cyanescens]
MVKLSSIGLALLTLVATSTAAPSPMPQSNSATSLEIQSRTSINNCGNSSFENLTSNGSPLAADCLRIASNIAGGGSWAVALLAHHQLVEYGTCAFGVQAGFYLGVTNFKVGNSDIIDLINDSVRKYKWNGKVGSKGTMPCQSDPSQLNIMVDWGIYHT